VQPPVTQAVYTSKLCEIVFVDTKLGYARALWYRGHLAVSAAGRCILILGVLTTGGRELAAPATVGSLPRAVALASTAAATRRSTCLRQGWSSGHCSAACGRRLPTTGGRGRIAVPTPCDVLLPFIATEHFIGVVVCRLALIGGSRTYPVAAASGTAGACGGSCCRLPHRAGRGWQTCFVLV
jgi:hypothetical protein